MTGRNYFDLCNEILQELFYEQVASFEALDDIAEGRKVKLELNSANNYICNNEQRPWKFRQIKLHIPLVGGMKKYPIPDGYIRDSEYCDTPIQLGYIENHKALPAAIGMPTGYYLTNGMLEFYPIPDDSQTNRLVEVDILTYDFARDKYGNLKCSMTCEDDVSIIPQHHRDILKWRVCADWRANINDAKSAYYESKFKNAYRALLADQKQSEDYPNRLDVMPEGNSFTSSFMRAFYNPWIGRGYKK